MSRSDSGNALADGIENVPRLPSTPLTADDFPTVTVTANVPRCGAERDGATCNLTAGHGGLHCSVPELMDASPEAFAQIEAESKDPARRHMVNDTFILDQLSVLFDRIEDKTITVPMARVALEEVASTGHTVEYILSLKG